MKRLLVIAGLFPPAGGAGVLRQVKLFKYLARLGWDIHVVAPRGGRGFFRDARLETELEGVTVHRVASMGGRAGWVQALGDAVKDPGRAALLSRMLARPLGLARSVRDLVAVPDEYAAFALRAAVEAIRLHTAHRFDALFTSSFPYSVHLGGWLVHGTTGLPWLVELRDPWRGHWFRGHGAPWRQRVDAAFEQAVFKAASAITVISPGVMRDIAAHHGPGVVDKLYVTPNGYDPEDFVETRVPASEAARAAETTGGADEREEAGREPRTRTQRDGGRLELLYTGSLDAVLEPPDPILHALSRVFALRPEYRERVRWRLLGGIDLESSRRIRAWVAEERAHDVIALGGFVPHREAIRAMRQADVLVLIQVQGARVYTSKVFEYLAIGRPILAAVGASDCRDLLQECGGAVLCAPDDIEGVARAILGAVERGTLEPVRARDPLRVAAYALPELAERVDTMLRAKVLSA